jgi:16S rRNA (uracil1498-N3)-methyltransferase
VNLRGRGPFVFVDDIDRPELADNDRHHLSRALRVRDGEEMVVSDGRGRWRAARFGSAIEIEGEILEDPLPVPAITVVFAPVKGDRPEWLVQKLTEIGVDRLVPMICDRSVVRWHGDRSDRALERLRRVAREAAMQSRRPRLPVIEAPVSFLEAVGWPGVAIASSGGMRPSLETPTVLIGPEGGWTDDELAAAHSTVSLGVQVLRAETAAVTAGTLLVALRQGLVT